MTTKILFVTQYTGLGGGETAILTLAKHTPNIEPHLLVPAEGAFSDAWRELGGRVHVQPFRGTTVYFVPWLWAQFPMTGHIQRVIQENGIEAVHSDYHALPFAIPAAQRAGIPCLWTCMGWWFKPKPWQRGFFRQPDVTFALSEITKRGFLGDPPFMPPEQVHVLYPGVDTERFSPDVDGSGVRAEINAGDRPVVLMVARFQDVKGHDTFIHAANRIAQQIPDAVFVVAGENLHSRADARYKQKMIELADQFPHVELHRLGHRSDVPQVMAAADIIVCASRFESFGVVNVEAMASGKPIVSTNRGGPAEVIVDGETGYLVPPDDPDAIAERVTELLRSEATRRSFGSAGRLRAQQIFSATAAANQFAEKLATVT